MPMFLVCKMPKNRGRCCGRVRLCTSACGTARFPRICELEVRRDVVALQEGITLGRGEPEGELPPGYCPRLGNEQKPPRTLNPCEQGAEPGRCLAWPTAAQGPLPRPPGIGSA